MPDDDAVLLDIDGPVATVTLNRPDRLRGFASGREKRPARFEGT